MNREELLIRINEIAKDVFDNENVILAESTTAADVDEWESLSHLNFINDIEDEFGITFTLSEITESRNVGEIIDAIIKHLDNRPIV